MTTEPAAAQPDPVSLDYVVVIPTLANYPLAPCVCIRTGAGIALQ